MCESGNTNSRMQVENILMRHATNLTSGVEIDMNSVTKTRGKV